VCLSTTSASWASSISPTNCCVSFLNMLLQNQRSSLASNGAPTCHRRVSNLIPHQSPIKRRTLLSSGLHAENSLVRTSASSSSDSSLSNPKISALYINFHASQHASQEKDLVRSFYYKHLLFLKVMVFTVSYRGRLE
jgi:hypothetical protein